MGFQPNANVKFDASIKRTLTQVSFLCALGIAVSLSGCKKEEGADKAKGGSTQVAAKVNGEELSIHQINFLLRQQPNVKPEQVDQASRSILEQLITQELAYQKAVEKKLDRDPNVVQAIEMSKKQLISTAYFQGILEGTPKPSERELKVYYDNHPGLFSARRIYNFQELFIEVSEAAGPALAKELDQKSVQEMVQLLKSRNIKFQYNQAVRAAEQLPLDRIEKISEMADGQVMFQQAKQMMLVTILAGSKQAPVTFDEAKPSIERFLMSQARNALMEAEIKNLKIPAKIEYVGKFAEKAASAADAIGLTTAPVASSAPPLAKPESTAMPEATASSSSAVEK